MRSRFSGLAILTLIIIALVAATAHADIALSKLFSDHMVLQQNLSMRIHGSSDAEEKLTVSFRGNAVETVADKNGKWSVVIGTGSAGGPFEFEVASRDSETKVIVKDVLVGEVWLCGGQSNMTFPVSKSSNAEQDIESAKKYPLIRGFNVQPNASVQPLTDFGNVDSWFCCSPDSIKDFSAIAYLFGRELNEKLDIPIGLISIAADKTTLEAWTPMDALKEEGTFDQLLKHWEERGEPTNPNRVSNCYNAMVAPISRFGFRGVIWFQGEANVGRGAQYRRMFPVMIRSWRKKLGQPNCPFLFVQPTPFRYAQRPVEALPEIWDAQLKTFRDVPGLGMVVATDLGSEQSKQSEQKAPIANRLANWAFAGCYTKMLSKSGQQEGAQPDSDASSDGAEVTGEPGQTLTSAVRERKIVASGPIVESATIVDEGILLQFKMTEGGLKLNPQNNHGFTICGKDRKFQPADVKIQGDQILVSHSEIESPIAVRYGWTDTAKPTLTNGSGLPASPFRTDDFPLLSDGVEF